MRVLGVLLVAVVIAAPLGAQGVPRFDMEGGELALGGPARPGAYIGDQGRRAAVFGDESGRFEVWTWPLKLVRDLRLAFRIPEYDEPVEGANVARSVMVRPEGITITYSHATFTVRQHVFVPMDEPGALMLLDVETARPLDVLVRMHADFQLAWPGSFGGGYITWQADQKRFLLSQGGVRLYNGFVGSPFAEDGTSHPAHDAPMVPSQFTLRFDTARASAEYIPIAISGSVVSRDSAEAVYRRLLANAERYWREKVSHYDAVSSGAVRLSSPEPWLDDALEWAKVNLDQQLVCNPDLGCGLVAGFGRAGAGNYRPGFGWFFGGDAAINSLAMTALGQHDLVRQGLEFLAQYQRDDGKITHEISQSAGRLPWFTDYPYTWFHGDTTPFWIMACYEYWAWSGDDDFLRRLWPNIAKAFRWSAATDRDGDGLMENPAAGAGAIEVGGLGAGLLTDIYLAGSWVVALDGLRAMAAAARDAGVEREASALYERARGTIESSFWLDGAGLYAFALLEGSVPARPRLNDALTVWPATAMSFGLLDPARSDRMLARMGSSDLTVDWGVRMLSREHSLYDPVHYNNGAVWPFVTGFAALAHYRHHRYWAGHDLIRDVARTTYDFALGRHPELMSGAFYRTLDTTVPQQFFATSMLASPLLRGMLGLSVSTGDDARLTIAPHLPASWDSASFRGIRVDDAVIDARVERRPDTTIVVLELAAGSSPVRVRVDPALPLGARVVGVTVDGASVQAEVRESLHDLHAGVVVTLQNRAVVRVVHQGGVAIEAPPEELAVGDASHSLRVLDFRREGEAEWILDLEGLAGTEYRLPLYTAESLVNDDAELVPTAYGYDVVVPFPSGMGHVRRSVRLGRAG